MTTSRATGLSAAQEPTDRAASEGLATRIPSLDGLRAISISAVILGHAAGTAGFPDWLSKLAHNPYVEIANLGVRVFFVISGYLITGLLVSELRKSGSIDLPRFYLRRTLRIFPAYYAFLATLAFLVATRSFDATTRDFLHAVTYTTNYHQDRSWSVGHLWSLAVEEQFYLLWPATLAVLGLRRGVWAAAAVVLFAPMVRLWVGTFVPEARDSIGVTFETTSDALAVGCLLALCEGPITSHPWYRRLVAHGWTGPAIIALGLALSLRFRPSLMIGMSVTSVGVAVAIHSAVLRPASRFGRLLNTRPLVAVGTHSYSIYLWQQIFLNRSSGAWYAAFPANLALVVIAAVLSYRLIETPVLRLRPSIERRLLGARTTTVTATAATHADARGVSAGSFTLPSAVRFTPTGRERTGQRS